MPGVEVSNPGIYPQRGDKVKSKPSTFLAVVCAVAVAGPWSASRALALRIVTYNILNYSSDLTREEHYRTILVELEPDILVVEEILSQSAVDRFLSQVLNHAEGPTGTYAAATFVNGPDTDNALFYRTDAVTFTSGDHLVIATALRDIDRWRLGLVGYESAAADLYVYTCHLKASQGSDNEQKRLAEATLMREDADDLPAGTNFVYTGDYNIYYSAEPAYQKLITVGTDPDGQGFDPIDRPGSWHVNFSFADIHSQSPRTTQFGGGAPGGMDDRFDIILQSGSLDDTEQMAYAPDSYFAYGQDGLHFDGAIIDPPTIPEGAAIATALHEASDHLPVVMDLQVPAKVGADVLLDFGTVIVGATALQDLSVSNEADLLTFIFADELDYSLSCSADFEVAPGPFEAEAGVGPNLHPVTMLTATRGLKDGLLDVASDDPDDPLVSVGLAGTVLSHARPSVSESSETTEQTLDFGSHAPGEFPPLAAEVHNFAYDSLQALLDVYDAEITGPHADKFFIQGGFAPASAGHDPAQYTVEVAANLGDVGEGQVMTADLVFDTRDQQDLPGAIDLGPVTFHLTAVKGSVCASFDFTGDGLVDLVDFATFALCFSNGATTPPPGCSPDEFAAADVDDDDDVDLTDFATFALCFGG